MDCENCSVAFTCVLGAFILYKILDRLVRIPFIGGLGDRYIFITGCDSGFGYETAKKLDAMGANVFAGCLTEAVETPYCSAMQIVHFSLKTLSLDVSKEESIKKAYDYVREVLPPGRGLHGVLNNAGVSGRYCGPVEWLKRADYEEVNAINLYGVVDTAVTMLPLLKKAKGRCVNTASVFGRFSLLGNTPYSVSKYGVEAFSDELRREMRPFGVTVHLIEPGFHKTNITNPDNITSAFEATWNRLPKEMKDHYGEEFLRKNKEEVIKKRIQQRCSERIHDVVDTYIHALLGCYPRARYVVGTDAKFVWLPVQFMPEWLGDKILEIAAGPDRPIPLAAK